VSDNARVYGDARVYGNAQVSDNARVSGDAWEKSPLQIRGTRHFITCAKYFHLQIGCHLHTFKEWKTNFKKIGLLAKYSTEEISEYGLYIDLAIKIYGLEAKK
jgi:hypothetical protein